MLIGFFLWGGTDLVLQTSLVPSKIGSIPVFAQAVRTQDLWREVYQQLPNFPLENQYISRQTGQIDSDNTLVRRLIQYHLFVKGRPANLRLDWKLTLADYLGVNELMRDVVYPGSDTLTQNPIDRDRQVINALSRTQRNELVQVLVEVLSSVPRR